MLGVSFDTAEANAAFAKKYDFPFPLLCDTGRELGLAYLACKAADEKYARRLTYVIGADKKIEQAIDTQDPGGQAAELCASL